MKLLSLMRKIIKNILPYYITHKYQMYEQVFNKRKNLQLLYEKLRLSDITELHHINWGREGRNNILLKVMRNDCKYEFYLRDKTMDLGTYQQIFIDKEYDFIANIPPKTIIDAGANIGLSSIYFANKFPNAKIIAIEPEMENFEILEKNVSKYSNIIPLCAALWDTVGQIDLWDIGLGNNAYMVIRSDSDNIIKTPKLDFLYHVNTVTIENILNDYNLERVDLLKMDIEGAEKEIFNNSKNWIQKIDTIIIELHERAKDGCCRAFYRNTIDFINEWSVGENIYLTRNNNISQA
jgi:FkbM family methyltransferase